MELTSALTYDGQTFNNVCATFCKYQSNLNNILEFLISNSCNCLSKASPSDQCCDYLINKFTSVDESVTINLNSNNHIYGVILVNGGTSGTVVPTYNIGGYDAIWSFTTNEFTFPNSFSIYIDNTLHNLGSISNKEALVSELNLLTEGVFSSYKNSIRVLTNNCETIDLSANIGEVKPVSVIYFNSTPVSTTSTATLMSTTVPLGTLINTGDTLFIDSYVQKNVDSTGTMTTLYIDGNQILGFGTAITNISSSRMRVRVLRVDSTTLFILVERIDYGLFNVPVLIPFAFVPITLTVSNLDSNNLDIQIVVSQNDNSVTITNSFLIIDKFNA